MSIVLLLVGCTLGYVVCLLLASRKEKNKGFEFERAKIELNLANQQRDSRELELKNLQQSYQEQALDLTTAREQTSAYYAALNSEKELREKEGVKLHELESEYNTTRNKLADSIAELARCKTALEKEQLVRAESAAQLAQLQDIHREQSEELSSAREQNSALSTALSNEKAMHEKSATRLHELESEYNTTRSKLADSIAELARCKTALEKEQQIRTESAAQLTQLQGIHREQSEELSSAREQNSALSTALSNEKTMHEKSATRLHELESEYNATRSKLTDSLAELARCKTALEKEQQSRTETSARLDKLQAEYNNARATLTEQLAELTHYKTALEKERQNRAEEAAKIKEMQEKHFAQFRNLAGEIMEQNAGKLKDTNKESMDSLLKPLRTQLENLGKAVTATNETAAGNKASLEAAIKAMMAKTESLSHEAESLTLALRGNTKKQGDWGEMILERMLEESGLRKGEEYLVQENYKTHDGKDVRPDVIIKFPEKRCVIVDSKVSLTAYTHYATAATEAERAAALKAHVTSVRKHIDELAAKDYSATVSDNISYVLMFMPNEASYMAALQAEPSLQIEAHRKKIVLISPTNLLMALQLAYNLWQKERQTRNVENIIEKATRLYEKMATVQDSLEKVGRGIKTAHDAYDQAFSQLFRGRGNYAKQLEDLRQMGISPNKRLRLEDDTE